MNPASGGPCQGIRNAIPALLAMGVENEVVCLDAPDSKYLGNDHFPIHALGPAKTPWQYNQQLLPWLGQNLHRFDAVVAHGLWLYVSFATFKAVEQLRKSAKKTPAFFVMPHGMLDPWFQKTETRRIKALRNVLYWKLLENRVVNGANGVLFTCQAELELARVPFRPYHPQAELNVGYGIPAPPVFCEAQTSAFLEKCTPAAGRPYLLFLSRIHPKKGVDLLLKAYHKYLDKQNESMALVIAGPGMEADYGKTLAAEVAGDPRLAENVFFPGMLTGNAKWGAFYNCEAFVLPSHQENFGIAVAEALACGKPVLISNQVNIWKEIVAANAGMAENDDEAGTGKLLLDFFAMNMAEKKAMAQNALRCYQQHFSIQEAATMFVKKVLPNYA